MSEEKTLTDSEKCAIIAEALETRVGRLLLAKTMVMPVKRAMGYKDSKVDLFFEKVVPELSKTTRQMGCEQIREIG